MSLIINTKTRKVQLGRTFDQIDDDEILNSATRTSSTTKQYESVIRKLKLFLKVREEDFIPIELVTDNYPYCTLPFLTH